MKKLFYTLIILMFQLAQAEESKLPEMNEAAVSIDYQDVFIKVNKDGSTVTTVTNSMRALNDKGRVDLSVQRIPYNPRTTEIKILEASLLQDGKKVVVPLKQIKLVDISDPNAPGTSSLKSYEIPHSGVKINGVVSYTAEIKDKKIGKENSFFDVHTFGHIYPEMKSRTRIESEIPLYVSAYDPKKLVNLIQKSPNSIEIRVDKPIFLVSANGAKSMSPQEIKDAIPRIHISSYQNWADPVKQNLNYYQQTEATPPELNALIAKAKEKKEVRDQVSYLMTWMSENLTYSTRWVNPDSGWRPRPLKEIIKTKVADCKDFAFFMMAALKELKIQSQPTYVRVRSSESESNFLAEPIDEKNPLPSTAYFNHVIVTYKLGNDWVTVDPGRGLGDPTRLPYYLNNSWALHLNPEAKPAFKTSISSNSYANLSMTSDLMRKPDGELTGETKVNIEGEAANFLKNLYFGEGEKSFKNSLNAFTGFYGAKNIHIAEYPKVDRSEAPLKFTITYNLSTEEGKRFKQGEILPIVPYFSALGRFAQVNFPEIPSKGTQKITIKDSFAKDEVESDCRVRGFAASIDRKVENNNGTVIVSDSVNATGYENHPTTKIEKDYQSVHISQLMNCFSSTVTLEKYDSKNPKQVSFESTFDTKKPFEDNPTTDKSHSKNMKEIRRMEAYEKAYPQDHTITLKKAREFTFLGFLHSDYYVKEYLLEAIKMTEAQLSKAPNDDTIFNNIGKYYLWLNDEPKAYENLMKAHKLNPFSYKSLSLSADIAERRKDYATAIKHKKAAAEKADNKRDKMRALNDIAFAYCTDLNKCSEAIPYAEKILALDLNDSWVYHNMAIIYKEAGNYPRAIELERKAMKDGEFGAARTVLIDALIKDSWDRIKGNVVESDDFPMVEKNLLEAYRYDQKNTWTIFNLIRFYALKAHAETSQAHLNSANQYYKELLIINPNDQNVPVATYTIKAVSERLSRAPASK